jgi:orotate phosphoribosyltransferase-like protein
VTEETAITRAERLLALLVLHNVAEASLIDKSVMLSRVGFSNTEIAQLLGKSTQTVTQSLYNARKATGRKRATKVSKARKRVTKATKRGPKKT